MIDEGGSRKEASGREGRTFSDSWLGGHIPIRMITLGFITGLYRITATATGPAALLPIHPAIPAIASYAVRAEKVGFGRHEM